MSAAEKGHVDLDASILATMDRMEENLRRYRLDSSTPKSDRDHEPKRQNNPTHWSYDMYDEKESQADNTLLFTSKKARVGVDYNTREPRYKSQYAYGIDGVRPKVHFADGTHGNRIEDDDMLRGNVAYGRQRSPEPDAHRDPEGAQFQRETSNVDKDNKIAIKPATYHDSSSWLDYKCHFEACANVNGWSEEKKGMFLALSLRGQAQAVLGDLPTDRGQHYGTLVRSLQE